MTQDRWVDVDDYLAGLLIAADPVLDSTLQASAAAGLPPIQVSPLQGKFLWLLARAQGADRILEIGTLGGYSTIWLARALPTGGRLITLEVDQTHADVARQNLDRADLGERVDIRVGPARDTLAAMVAAEEAPFDLVFVDADKAAIPNYVSQALVLSRPGTVILVDNVVRGGAILDTSGSDPDVEGVRSFYEMISARAGVEATVLQTVGTKGYDGLAMVLVMEPTPRC